ncbi:hypothetical protein H9P43_007861, partial [Blastocladiella emersonii ATCC 22665]
SAGRLDLLDKCVGFDWAKFPEPYPTDIASACGQADVLKWLKAHARVGRYTEDTVEEACSRGHIQVLEWWSDESDLEIKFTWRCMKDAVEHNHCKVVEWFCDKVDEQWDDVRNTIPALAMLAENMELLDNYDIYLRESWARFVDDWGLILEDVVNNKRIQVLDWIYSTPNFYDVCRSLSFPETAITKDVYMDCSPCCPGCSEGDDFIGHDNDTMIKIMRAFWSNVLDYAAASSNKEVLAWFCQNVSNNDMEFSVDIPKVNFTFWERAIQRTSASNNVLALALFRELLPEGDFVRPAAWDCVAPGDDPAKVNARLNWWARTGLPVSEKQVCDDSSDSGSDDSDNSDAGDSSDSDGSGLGYCRAN